MLTRTFDFGELEFDRIIAPEHLALIRLNQHQQWPMTGALGYHIFSVPLLPIERVTIMCNRICVHSLNKRTPPLALG